MAKEIRISLHEEDLSDAIGLVLDLDTMGIVRVNSDGSRIRVSSPSLDFGNTTAAELVANGPKTLYTPANALVPVILLFAEGEDLANSAYISFGPFSDNPSNPGLYWTGDGHSQDGLFPANLDAYVGSARFFPGGAVKARWGVNYTSDGQVLLSAAGTWQANHAYTIGEGIISDGGYVNVVMIAGTSGGTEPTWPDDGYSDTVDGGVTWHDNGPTPVTGSVHVIALTGISTSVTP